MPRDWRQLRPRQAASPADYSISNGTCPDAGSSLLDCGIALEAACARVAGLDRGYCCPAQQQTCVTKTRTCNDGSGQTLPCGDSCCLASKEECVSGAFSLPQCQAIGLANPYSSLTPADANAVYVAMSAASPSATRYPLTLPVTVPPLPTATATHTSSSSSLSSATLSPTPALTPTPTPPPSPSPSAAPAPFHVMGGGGVAAIAIGSFVTALLITVGLFFWDRRRKKARAAEPQDLWGTHAPYSARLSQEIVFNSLRKQPASRSADAIEMQHPKRDENYI